MPNPYAPPSAEPPPSDASRRVWIALIPLFAAVVAGVILVALGSRPPPTPQAADWAFGASGVFLVFDVPVCVFVLAKWFLNGEPPDLFAELGIAQPREMRELFRQLKTRPKLDDDAFYETYFAGTSIPKNVPIKLRDALDETYDRDFRGVHPTDKVVFVEFDLDSDWDDVYDWLQSVFDMTISDEMRREELNGTFLSLVECVVDPRCREATEEAKRLAALQPPPTGYSRPRAIGLLLCAAATSLLALIAGSTAMPTLLSPQPMLVVLPLVLGLPVVFVLAIPPVAFALLHHTAARHGPAAALSARITVLLGVASAGCAGWLALGFAAITARHGTAFALAITAINLGCLGLLWTFWQRLHRGATYFQRMVYGLLLHAWLFWYAFPCFRTLL